ncbi:MAG: DUF1800 domain-containing protein [Granulosicoccus sp.]
MKIIIKILLPLTVLLVSACGGGTNPIDKYSPAAAPALPATEVANAIPDGPLTRREAFRLVEQSTFGPQLDDINYVARIGPENWINEQLQSPATFLLTGLLHSSKDRWRQHVNVWWRNSIQADDQLRQRVAFALSEILVISSEDSLGEEQSALAGYYDILVRNAFGNYRDLIEEVTLSPVMGEYLSMKGNQKPDPEYNIRPDENYARELLQLFTIGLVELNPDGTPKLDDEGVPLPAYNQSHIEAFAHVFTGWQFANADDFRWPEKKDYMRPMKSWAEFHDTGKKQLLRGVTLPAGQTAEEDLDQALDNLFNHPNVGPFIVRQLIQRLVTSNPSPQYIEDVAAVFNKNAAGERGSLGSTIKAILMHREARQGHLDQPEIFGKPKEPLLRLTQLWRAFEPESIHNEFDYAWADNELAQAPLASASVFNFFRPDFSQPGEIYDQGLSSPEFQIMDETSIITITSRLLASTLWSHNYKSNNDTHRIAIDISREMQLEGDHEALIKHLDMLLLGGRMSRGLREEVLDLMASKRLSYDASQRVVEAIFLIISSPEAAVQI